jgi:hypothetical protein
MSSTKLKAAYLSVFAAVLVVLLGAAFMAFKFTTSASNAGSSYILQATGSPAIPNDRQALDTRRLLTVNALSVETLGIHLPVEHGEYDPDTRQWTLNNTSAFISTINNPTGQINLDGAVYTPLIYGHNYEAVLGKIKHISSNDIVTLHTDGVKLRYKFLYAKDLDPTNSWILSHRGEEDLIIMTCAGFWDQNRRALFFERVEEALVLR